jgi:hypothetical protein
MENIAEVVQGLLSSEAKVVVGDFPSLDAEGISVKLGEGEEATRYLGMTTTINRPYIIVVARSESYSTAKQWLASCRAILDGYRSDNILGILVTTPTIYIGRDDQKMHDFQVTYKIMIKE